MATNEHQASNDWSKADIISLLAPHLSEDLKAQALNTARNLSDAGARASALTSLSEVLEAESQTIQTEALTIAKGIENQYLKVRVFSEVANPLPDDQKKEILAQALGCVKQIPTE